MTPKTAIAKLKAALGANFAYRLNPKAPKAPERAAAAEKVREMGPKVTAAKEALSKRREAVLLADPEYQRLLAEHRALEQEFGAAKGTIYSCPITVGTNNGLFFSVKAEGDNWQEVVDKVTGAKA